MEEVSTQRPEPLPSSLDEDPAETSNIPPAAPRKRATSGGILKLSARIPSQLEFDLTGKTYRAKTPVSTGTKRPAADLTIE